VRRRELVAALCTAITWPLRARAQQPLPVTGYLSVGSPETDDIPERLVAYLFACTRFGRQLRLRKQANRRTSRENDKSPTYARPGPTQMRPRIARNQWAQ
jgi:hypothetical protein